MRARKLLSMVSGEATWDLLRLLFDQQLSASEVASRLNVTTSTARSHLSRLKEAGFVEIKKPTRPHTYGVVEELPGPVHEWVLVLLLMDDSINVFDPDQVRDRLESMREGPADTEWFDRLLDTIGTHYPRPNVGKLMDSV